MERTLIGNVIFPDHFVCLPPIINLVNSFDLATFAALNVVSHLVNLVRSNDGCQIQSPSQFLLMQMHTMYGSSDKYQRHIARAVLH